MHSTMLAQSWLSNSATGSVCGTPVLIRGVPNLSTERTAALAASDFPQENAYTAVSSAFPCASLHLPLHHLEHGRVDDGGMALFHEVARHLPAVLDGFLGEEVRREGLLDSRAAHVFLIGEDPLDGLGIPLLLARDRQDMPCGQFLGNLASRHTFQKKLKDEPHDLGPLLVDGEIAFLAFIVAEKARIADGELAVCEPLPLQCTTAKIVKTENSDKISRDVKRFVTTSCLIRNCPPLYSRRDSCLPCSSKSRRR